MQPAASPLVNEVVKSKASRKVQAKKNPAATAEAAKSIAPNLKTKGTATAKSNIVAQHATKQDAIVVMLGSRDGATISDIMKSTGWQMQSVRGFLAGTVKKKLGLKLVSSKAHGEVRKYRIVLRGR